MITLTPMSIIAAFGVVAAGRYFIVPLLREWPGDMPEAERLRVMSGPREYFACLKSAVAALPSAWAAPTRAGISPELSDRIKLAVAVEYRCDLCSYLYAQAAVDKGASGPHVRRLLAGRLDREPRADAALISFSRAYAKSDGRFGEAAARRIESELGTRALDRAMALAALARFASICCNTARRFERARLDDAERRRSYLAYLLARPIEWSIARSAARRESMRVRMEV